MATVKPARGCAPSRRWQLAVDAVEHGFAQIRPAAPSLSDDVGRDGNDLISLERALDNVFDVLSSRHRPRGSAGIDLEGCGGAGCTFDPFK